MAALTDLERQRNALVERNRWMLQQLEVPVVSARRHPAAPISGKARPGKRAAAEVVMMAPGERRRSARLAACDAPRSYREVDDEAERARGGRRGVVGEAGGPSSEGARELVSSTEPPAEGDGAAKLAASAPPAADSVRATAAAPAAQLDPWLGRVVTSTANPPKASAIALLAAGSPEAHPPRFSKYSGVAELADAVAVFVNLNPAAGRGEVYDNAFSEGGRLMSWYASSRMTEDTPAVRRLLSTLESGGGHGAERVLLFLREPGGYYTFCGRVAAASWVPGSRPLQLRWRLCQFDQLRSADAFQHLLGPVLEQPSVTPK